MKENFTILEWLISEMELKLHQARILHPAMKFEDSELKIKALKKVQSYVYETFEQNNKVLIRNSELNLINQQLNKK